MTRLDDNGLAVTTCQPCPSLSPYHPGRREKNPLALGAFPHLTAVAAQCLEQHQGTVIAPLTDDYSFAIRGAFSVQVVHEILEGGAVIREVPAGEWRPFLARFSGEHRAWLATLHVVDARETVTRCAQIPLKSAALSGDAVKLEFLSEGQSLCAHNPSALRIQQTDIGLVQALEIEGSDGQLIRLAFRATAMPEQLDGLAPGELMADGIPAERSAAAPPATHSRMRDEP